MLSRFLIFLVAVILNVVHLFIPARIINYNFDPLLALLAFITFLTIVYFTSSFKRDFIFIFLIFTSFISQVIGYYQNGGGAPDYLNLLFLDSNIPDFIISLTILTWWYYRVYKQPNFIPAKIERNG